MNIVVRADFSLQNLRRAPREIAERFVANRSLRAESEIDGVLSRLPRTSGWWSRPSRGSSFKLNDNDA
ncbi:hypothetical protein [Consotaella salsifontis]|uniref:Uncharacterized protein n=1 Tax=Consotaella salsifontis TaxID=1365950 RepID=A0A1T4MED9_9HYPH|nr:hypothetical protein [Consotaella salsifontis]SJZ65283.1 hypothetical protein SAMN05428963_10284 [Consotaella salsifontis]